MLIRVGQRGKRICDPVETDLARPTDGMRSRNAPRSEAIRDPADHFLVYFPPLFDQTVGDQIAFLQRHLKVGSALGAASA